MTAGAGVSGWWRGPLGPPRVLEAQDPRAVRTEGEDCSRALRQSDRVAILAHWDAGERVSRSTGELIGALQGLGFAVLLVNSAAGAGPLIWTTPRPAGLTVLRRPNIGHDFGSWATALDRVPELRRAGALLLMNDSLVGPFASPAPLFERFLAGTARFWGLTDSREEAPHIQSYCLGFRGGILEHPRLRAFWRGIRVERDKGRVVRKYEIGLSRLMRRLGVASEVALPGGDVVQGSDNPTLHGWRRLIERGFPFVKRRVVREEGRWSPDEPVATVLRRHFGVDLDAWT